MMLTKLLLISILLVSGICVVCIPTAFLMARYDDKIQAIINKLKRVIKKGENNE